MKTDLLKALDSATSEDLEAIKEEIEVHRKKIESLVRAHKLLAHMLGGGDAPRKTTKRDASGLEKRERVAMHLLKNGPTRPFEIADQCAIRQGSVYWVLKHPWFVKTGEVFVLTDAGRAAVEQVAHVNGNGRA